LELLALLGDRFMTWSLNSVCEDWLIFFGASLCHFCPNEQLVKELQAIAVSLECKSWQTIKDKYEHLIICIARDAVNGFLKLHGQHVSIDRDDWFYLVSNKLEVSQDEIRRLGLNVIVEDQSDYMASGFDVRSIQPVGEFKFIPLERLMIKAVA
jgi:hypothetical protein